MDQELRAYLDAAFAGLEKKFDTKFDALETSIGALETRIGTLETHIGTLETRMGALETRMSAFEAKLVELEERMIEKMRDMQTELLRGFESFSSGQTIRLRKLEADHSNLDSALQQRMDVLESRLLQIEFRLGKASGT